MAVTHSAAGLGAVTDVRPGSLPDVDTRVWFAEVLRFARRDADMSQRELARWSGVPKSTIGDIETGMSAVSLRTAMVLLRVAGFEVVIRGPAGEVVDEFLIDQRRDCVDRRFPAHLDLRPKREEEVAAEAVWRRSDQPAPSRWTFRINRQVRDYLRFHGWYGELGAHPRAPSQPDLASMGRYGDLPPPPIRGWFRREEESGRLRTRAIC